MINASLYNQSRNPEQMPLRQSKPALFHHKLRGITFGFVFRPTSLNYSSYLQNARSQFPFYILISSPPMTPPTTKMRWDNYFYAVPCIPGYPPRRRYDLQDCLYLASVAMVKLYFLSNNLPSFAKNMRTPKQLPYNVRCIKHTFHNL